MRDDEYLTVGLRAWPADAYDRKNGDRNQEAAARQRPVQLLVLDTETRIDPGQALTFGSAQLVRLTWRESVADSGVWQIASFHTKEEVLFHADDLAESDPTGYKTLVTYAEDSGVTLVSRSDFMKRYVWRYCVPHDTPEGWPQGNTPIVGFNLPFDLSRLAESGSPARTVVRNGVILSPGNKFSFRLWPLYQEGENRYRPHLLIEHSDSTRSFINWGTRQESAGKGQFIDVRTLINGLTGESVSLDRACRMAGVPGKNVPGRHGEITPDYITYNRQDVNATVGVAVYFLNDFYTHPVDLAPDRVYSPAAVAKGYLRKMGLPAIRHRTGIVKHPRLLGVAMSAFYGGRAEAHIRHTAVPVAVVDFASMYCTVNALMGLWDVVTAAEIVTVDCTDEMRDFIGNLTLDDVLDPNNWPRFRGFVQVMPAGDILPVRAKYQATVTDRDRDGTNYNIGVNPFHSPRPLWYTIADILASTLLTGKAPQIIRAVRLEPRGGNLDGLQPVQLDRKTRIDPNRDDFFRLVVERRQELKARTSGHRELCPCPDCRTARFLKELGNAGSFGIYVEMHRDDDAKVKDSTVYGAWADPWNVTPNAVEKAGDFCYPPMAAVITGAGRLMLAILERLVTDAGGTWAFCDTDSMAFVANRNGTLVPCAGGPYRTPDGVDAVQALTYQQVDAIRATVNRLNPYARSKVPSILKLETPADVFCYAVSAKRYALFTYDAEGRPVVPDTIQGKRAYMELGLALYRNPSDIESSDRDWIRQAWQWIVDRAHGLDAAEPEWFGRVPLTRVTVSAPSLLRLFRDYNATRPYAEQVKPFNFLLHVREQTTTGAGRPFIAAYSSDPNDWFSCDWYDRQDPTSQPVRIGTAETAPGQVTVSRMQQVVHAYSIHKEAKAVGPDGMPCRSRTHGLLSRRTVRVASNGFVHIGKETNRLEDAQNGLIDSLDDVVTSYGGNPLSDALDVFADIPSRKVAALYNAYADRIATKIRKLRAALSREARYYIPKGLTGVAKEEATAAYLDKEMASQMRMQRLGVVEPVTHDLIARWKNGGTIGVAPLRILTILAAQQVAPFVDRDADSVPKRLAPEIVLAQWRDAGKPPYLLRDCPCGCGHLLTGRQHAASAACRMRISRRNRQTV